jgi:probable HAF family extracellular repeat protein
MAHPASHSRIAHLGTPVLLLAQYSETNMLGGYNISPSAAGTGGIFAGTYSPGFQSASPVIYKPATGWAGLPVGLGFVSSLYGIHLNYWDAATAISHDGSVVAGSATGTLTNGFQATYAAYWTNGAESLVHTPPDDPTATAMTVTAISGDGSTLVVQDDNNAIIYGGVESYVYRIASGTFTSLGFFPGTTNQQTHATAISKDGTIVAGYYALNDGEKHGFLWKAASGMTDIGIPASVAGASFVYLQPNCISDDGTTLFGTLSIGTGWGGFRYNTTNGFQDLGDLSPTACTADGSEAVGTKGILNYPAIWSPGTGSGTVANLLSANGIAPSANGIAGPVTISQDGSAMTAVTPNPTSGEQYPTVTPILITLPVPLKRRHFRGPSVSSQRLIRRRSLSRLERSCNMPISTRACPQSSSADRTMPPHSRCTRTAHSAIRPNQAISAPPLIPEMASLRTLSPIIW